MNISIKFATTLALTATALIASVSTAQAGEGGAAGSVSVIIDSKGVVSNLSAAAAVGKLNAAAATLSTPFTTSASAFGSAGEINLTGANIDHHTIDHDTIQDASYVGSDEKSDTIGKAQANNLTGKTTIDAKAGTVIIPNVAAPAVVPNPQ